MILHVFFMSHLKVRCSIQKLFVSILSKLYCKNKPSHTYLTLLKTVVCGTYYAQFYEKEKSDFKTEGGKVPIGQLCQKPQNIYCNSELVPHP